MRAFFCAAGIFVGIILTFIIFNEFNKTESRQKYEAKITTKVIFIIGTHTSGKNRVFATGSDGPENQNHWHIRTYLKKRRVDLLTEKIQNLINEESEIEKQELKREGIYYD